MKLNLDNIIKSLKVIFTEYPIEAILSIIIVVYSIFIIEWEPNSNYESILLWMLIWLLSTYLFLFNGSIFNKNLNLNNEKNKNIISIFIFVLCIIIWTITWFMNYYSMEYYIEWYSVYVAILFIIWFMLITISPFIKNKNINNKKIFDYFWNWLFALLFAILVSSILYIWFVILLISLDFLFWIKIEDTLYLDMFIVIFWILWSYTFLYFFPSKIENLSESLITNNKALSILSKYILPILIISYILILYAYTIKIIFITDWPSWQIGRLVWVLSIIVLWINVLSNWISDKSWFFLKFINLSNILIIPLLFVYLTSFYIRINEYWLTVNRYYWILIWITLIIYFVLNSIKERKINCVFTISIIALLFSLSPFVSSTSVSKYFLTKTLEKQLNEIWVVKNWIISKYEWNEEIDYEKFRSLNSTISYMISMYWPKSISKFLPENISINNDKLNYELTNEIIDYMWIEVSKGIKNNYIHINYTSNEISVIEVSEYNKFFSLNEHLPNKNGNNQETKIRSEWFNLIIYYENKEYIIDLEKNIQFKQSKKIEWSRRPEYYYNYWNYELVSQIYTWENYLFIVDRISWNNKEKFELETIEWKLFLK